MKLMKQVLLCVLALINPMLTFADDTPVRKEGTHFLEKQREFSEGTIQLMPDFSFGPSIQTEIKEHDTEFLVEFIYTLPPLPENFQTFESLANLLLIIDTLEGIEYYSGGRHRMYPYIKKSYRVEDQGSRKKLPPLTFQSGENNVQFIQYQKDTSFGSNWYEVSVRLGNDAIVMTTLNLTELKAFTKKTAEPEGVLLHMAVIPGAESVVLYCAVSLKQFPPIGWSQAGVAGSFNHRISALEAWLADRIYGGENN